MKKLWRAGFLLTLMTAMAMADGLPAGVPTLDGMAGDWLPMTLVANPPDVHNFNQMVIVGRDLTSYYCNPGGLFTHSKVPGVQWVAGYPLVTMQIDGVEYPAVEARWFAYKALRRNANCGGIAVETDTRMVNEQRGVLCEVTLTNTTAQPLTRTVTLTVPGTPEGDGTGVANSTSRRGSITAVRPMAKPDAVTVAKDGVVWTWKLNLPAGGAAKVGYVAGDGPAAQAAATDSRVAAWAGQFEKVMADCEKVWEKRWIDAFTPGNGHFSGSLPALQTSNAALARNYYMGVLTTLVLERTQFPVSPRSFITSGERGDGIQYYWDASMMATSWALLEPAGMKASLRRWLVQNPRTGAHTSLGSTKGYDPVHYDVEKGYSFDACTVFRSVDIYLRITGDLKFLDEKLENGKTVLDNMDALATDWETLPKGPQGLVNFGGNGDLLECAPAYINCVPSLNAQDVWMARRMAEWHALHGEQDRARALEASAAAALPAVLGLYEKGQGVWDAYHMDGTKVELRHCVDYIYAGGALEKDLSAEQKAEMNAFVKKELFMKDWMRAMSQQDQAAPRSDRPDHGPLGAYDGWIPLTVRTMWQLGDRQAAFDFYCRTAVVTREGPFAQAHEFYGPTKNQFDAPVRIAERKGCMKECICGGAFTDVVIDTFFGFDPSVDGRRMIADPGTPRAFEGTLTGLMYHGKSYQLSASGTGVKVSGSF